MNFPFFWYSCYGFCFNLIIWYELVILEDFFYKWQIKTYLLNEVKQSLSEYIMLVHQYILHVRGFFSIKFLSSWWELTENRPVSRYIIEHFKWCAWYRKTLREKAHEDLKKKVSWDCFYRPPVASAWYIKVSSKFTMHMDESKKSWYPIFTGQGHLKLCMVGIGRQNNNVGHNGWPMRNNCQSHWLKTLKNLEALSDLTS